MMTARSFEQRPVLILIIVALAAGIAGSSYFIKDPAVGALAAGGIALTVVSAGLCIWKPTAHVLFFMVILITAPSFQFRAIPVSAIDAVAAGTIIALPAVVRSLTLLKPVVIATLLWLTVLAASVLPGLLGGSQYGPAEALRVARMSAVLLPILLIDRCALPFLQVSTRLLIAGTTVLALGLITFHAGYALHVAPLDPVVPQYIYLPGQTIPRATGIYGEASPFGDVGALVILLAWLRFATSKSPISIGFNAAAAAVGAMALLTSYSRSSLLFLVAAAIVVLVRDRRRLVSVAVAGGLVGIAWTVLAIYEPQLLDAYLVQRLGVGSQTTTDLTTGRLDTWPAVLGKFASQPPLWILGGGYKSLALNPDDSLGLVADNNYLSALVETGMVGLLAMMGWLFALGRYLYRLPESRLQLLALAIYGGLVAASLTVDALTYYRMVGLLILLATSLPRRSGVSDRSPGGVTALLGIDGAVAVETGRMPRSV